MSVIGPVAFLDRDGTLVKCDVLDDVPVPKHDSLELVAGAMEACDLLRHFGFALVLVTNQPDVARGRVDRRTVEEANRHVAALLGLDLVLACLHDDLDRCACRKPKPGLLLEAATILGADLDRSSVVIGDRWRDIDAGVAAGVTTVLIDRGYGEVLNARPDHVAPDLVTAAEWIGANLVTRSQR